jgi:hypothetical protein
MKKTQELAPALAQEKVGAKEIGVREDWLSAFVARTGITERPAYHINKVTDAEKLSEATTTPEALREASEAAKQVGKRE